MGRGFAAVLALIGLAAATAAAPAAEPAGEASARPSLRAAPTRALPSARVLVAGRNFHRRRRSAIFLGRTRLKTFRTRRNGSFRFYVRVPRRRPGLYRLSARSGKRRARARFRILAPPAAGQPAPAPSAQPASQPPPAPTKLVAAGDIACHPDEEKDVVHPPQSCHHKETSDRVIALDPDVVAPLGDLQYERGFPEDYLGSYAPTWGRFKDISRPAAGNHEYAASDDRITAPGYYGYFGELAGDPGKGYYTYELGNWQAIALNSGDIAWAINDPSLDDDCFPVSCKAGQPQETWLRQVLSSLPPQKCVVAYWHHPRWSSTNPFDYDEVAPLYQALYDHGVELALVGHSHAYERFAPMHPDGTVDEAAGVRQFVIGTGGKDRRFADPTPATTRTGSQKQLLNATGFGVLELSLHQSRYEFRFVHESGSVLDEGGGSCHDAG